MQCIDKIAAEKAPIDVITLIDEYIDKLLPFSGHVLDSVRTAVMETFNSILTQIATQFRKHPRSKKPQSSEPLVRLFNECCVSIVSEKNDYIPSIDDLINNKIKTDIPHNNTLLTNTVKNVKLIIEIISIAYKSTIKTLVERIDKMFKLFLLGSRGKITKSVIEKFGGTDRAVPLPEQKERFDILFNGAIVLSQIIQCARKSKINAEDKLKEFINLPNAIILVSLTSQYDELHTPKLKGLLEEKFKTYQYDDFNSFEWKIISENYRELSLENELPPLNNSKDLENVLPQL